MLPLGFLLLAATVGMGAYMLARGPGRIHMVHGTAGAFALLLVILGLRAQPHPSAHTSAIGLDIAGLLVGGLCLGLYLATLWSRGQRPPGLVVFLHATAGGLAFLLLAGLVLGH